ncbi:MAG: RnfABCDGE type electron transport complex subunit D [bacterium]
MSETRLMTVSASPHLRSPKSVSRIMWLVCISLVPVLGASVWFFGLRAAWIVLLSVGSAVGFEALTQRAFGRRITITDGSAALTGLLLAFNLPPGVPWWLPVVGSAFAVVVAKGFFGGLGHNFVNPALAGRALLMASWPGLMTARWLAPAGGSISGIDAVTAATPLGVLKNASEIAGATGGPAGLLTQVQSWPVIGKLFFGQVGGCIGETSALALLIGGLLLVVTRVVDWRIPLSYLLTVAVLVLVLPGAKAALPNYVLFHLLAGGLMLGAFFMATDYVTSPITGNGRLVFGIGCGVLTVLIRLWGGFPEGVSYAILLMNVATPFIDRLTRPRLFGQIKATR